MFVLVLGGNFSRLTVGCMYNYGEKSRTHTLNPRNDSYGRVVAVVGKNPHKQYAVSPEARADLLRKILEDYRKQQMSSTSTTDVANIEVRGKLCPNHQCPC